MKKLFLFALLTTFTGITVFSQDLIIRTNGEKVFCKVQREDSTTIFITLKKDIQELQTSISRTDINSIQIGYQENTFSYDSDVSSKGFGLGMEYGGIGCNVIIYYQRNIGIFGGVGYAIAGMGYNVGTKFRLITKKSENKVIPYCLAMYGYNAAIAISNANNYNKLFYGPTIGFGIDVQPRLSKNRYWSFAVMLPFRSPEVDNYIDDLKKNHRITFNNNLLPITISIGYRFF